jgi:hypothetical protein
MDTLAVLRAAIQEEDNNTSIFRRLSYILPSFVAAHVVGVPF